MPVKTGLLLLALFICYPCIAQKRHFIRVFDNNKHKIAKGYLQTVSDSSLSLTQPHSKKIIDIAYSKIGSIKLGYSTGHFIVLATLTCTIECGIVSFAVANYYIDRVFPHLIPPFEGFLFGSKIGAISGFILGSTVGVIKSSTIRKIAPVASDFNNWQMAKAQLVEWLKK